MFRKMRRSGQEVSEEHCREILKAAKRGVLSVVGDEGVPYGVPLNFLYDEEANTIWFHCARPGEKLDAIRRDGRVCFTVWDEEYRKPGDWAWYVTSVIVRGRAEPVEEPELLRDRMWTFAMKYCPSEEDARKEMSALDRVQLVGIRIGHMTGKLVHEK